MCTMSTTFLLLLVTGMVRCMRGYFPHEHLLPCVPKGKHPDLLKCVFCGNRFQVISVVHVNMRGSCVV